ncbi:MAG: Na+/H+ antiporter subunit C [Gemmatimonadales bacterium]|jgi:multicomponent Na+:H+ antiporter subunit C
MEALLALVVGALTAAAVYSLLQRHLLRVVLGIVLLGNAVNLLILAAGRVRSTTPPIVPEGMQAPAGAIANPLPQALVLTAIVIGFGLAAFALLLMVRAWRTLGTVDVSQLERAEQGEEP